MVATALFRDPPPDGYDIPEQLTRTPIKALRDALADRVALLSQLGSAEVAGLDEDAFRLEAADRAGSDPTLRAALAAAFMDAGLLGDIRGIGLSQLGTTQAARLNALTEDTFREAMRALGVTLDTVRSGEAAAGGGAVTDIRMSIPPTVPGGARESTEFRAYAASGYLAQVWEDSFEAGRRGREALETILSALPPRTFREAELLLVKEFTHSDLTRLDVNSEGYERGSRRIRHVGRGRTVEEARKINKQLREWGPMVAATLRGAWAKDSRGTDVDTQLSLSATGAMHFTKNVEPHVLDQLVSYVWRLDRFAALTQGVNEMVGAAWDAAREAGHAAGLPPRGRYVEDAVSLLEDFVAGYMAATPAQRVYPKTIQAAANVYLASVVRGLSVPGRLPPRDRRGPATAAAALAALRPVVQRIFEGGILPASGATPSPTDIDGAMIVIEQRLAAHGADVDALVANLGGLLA